MGLVRGLPSPKRKPSPKRDRMLGSLARKYQPRDAAKENIIHSAKSWLAVGDDFLLARLQNGGNARVKA